MPRNSIPVVVDFERLIIYRNESVRMCGSGNCEAVINAIIHNNYTNEIPPKFELFPNRLEITSAGGLPPEFDEDEFFMGYSVPRNKELMRVFKDLEMVEYLGSGIPLTFRRSPSIFHNFY